MTWHNKRVVLSGTRTAAVLWKLRTLTVSIGRPAGSLKNYLDRLHERRKQGSQQIAEFVRSSLGGKTFCAFAPGRGPAAAFLDDPAVLQAFRELFAARIQRVAAGTGAGA